MENEGSSVMYAVMFVCLEKSSLFFGSGHFTIESSMGYPENT